MVPVPSQIDEIPELYELLGSRRYSVYILREKVEENPGTGKGIAWICLG